MRKFELYTSTKTYMFPNGQLASPEAVAQRYPATAVFAHAVETDADSEVLFALENLSALRSRLGIDPALSAQDAIDEINVIANAAPETSDIPSAEERIAAALEAQLLLAMPDAENDAENAESIAESAENTAENGESIPENAADGGAEVTAND